MRAFPHGSAKIHELRTSTKTNIGAAADSVDKKRVESCQHRGSSSRIAMSFPALAGACMQLAKVVDQARACLFARRLKGV